MELHKGEKCSSAENLLHPAIIQNIGVNVLKRSIIAATATFVALTASAGFATTFAATTPATNLTYTVKAGDTLYKIATAEHVSLAALESANPQITNVASIYPGETIHLPLSVYTVQPGDTLYKIAVANGVSLAAIQSANPQISNYNNLSVGQTVNIPATSTPATASSTPTASSTSPSQTATSPSSIAAERQSIVTYGESLIGTPYAWGGDTPSAGFDCSGLVEYVYQHAGITLPRESHDQATIGTPVSQSALQPGDLLFFQDTDSNASLYANHVTHVGIYIGNGAMLESSSSKGVIIVQNVFSNSYYTSHYYGARNVIG